MFSWYSNPPIDCIFADWHQILKIKSNDHTLNSVTSCYLFAGTWVRLYIYIYAVHVGADWGEFGTPATSETAFYEMHYLLFVVVFLQMFGNGYGLWWLYAPVDQC